MKRNPSNREWFVAMGFAALNPSYVSHLDNVIFSESLTRIEKMRRDSKRRGSSPDRKTELATMASRGPGFYRKIADQVLTMEDVASPYVALLRKGKQIDDEFLKSTWPDYEADMKVLVEIQGKIAAIDGSVTSSEIVKILDLVRADLKKRGDI